MGKLSRPEVGRRALSASVIFGRLDLTWQLGLTLIIALVGLLLARRFHLPGGMVIGAMAATAAASLLNVPLAQPPVWMRTGARIVLGVSIGAAVTVETLKTVASALLPVVFLVLAMALVGLGLARLMNRATGMSLATALCGSAPGVLAAMVALADDLGGDSAVVASLHLVRLVSVLFVVPTLAYALFEPSAFPQVAAAAPVGADTFGLVVLLAIGLIAGFAAMKARVPAGDLLASLVIAAILNAAWLGLDAVPSVWRSFAQWIVGAGIGAAVTRQTLRTFKPFAKAGALMTASFLIMALALAAFLFKATSLDPVTCLVAAAPGGADQMIILAGELGGDAQLVAAVHVARQIILMLLVPFLVRGTMRRRGRPLPLPQ